MDGVSLSLPLFLVGLGLLLWAGLGARADRFHALAFAVSLLAGFVTAGVVWRLDRLAPLAMGARLPTRRSGELWALLPFAGYAVFATLVFSRFWDVPAHVSLAYGELRFLVQAVNLLGMLVCTVAVSRSFLRGDAVRGLVQVIWWVTAVNVLVVGYQYAALVVPGLPQLGISRSHDQGLDIAAFSHGALSIFRPGALAGEPKALAAIMVLYLVTWSAGVDFGNRGPIGPTSSRWLAVAALFVVLATFSTTAVVTLVVAGLLVHLANAGEESDLRAIRRRSLIALSCGVVVFGVAAWFPSGAGLDLLTERYVGRLQGFVHNDKGLDQIALMAWSDSPFRVVCGTGLGGISFEMMPYLDSAWSLAYAPNIGSVTVLCELGLLGMGLLLVPAFRLVLRSRERQRREPCAARRTARALGICLCVLWLVGSGPSLGLAMGLGLLAAAASAEFAATARATARATAEVPGRADVAGGPRASVEDRLLAGGAA